MVILNHYINKTLKAILTFGEKLKFIFFNFCIYKTLKIFLNNNKSYFSFLNIVINIFYLKYNITVNSKIIYFNNIVNFNYFKY